MAANGDAGGEADFTINGATFLRRLGKFYAQWKAEREGAWKNCDSVLIMSGKSDDESIYDKAIIFSTWLFGAEFPETIMCMTREAFFILSSAKKVSLVEAAMQAAAGEPAVPVKLLRRNKEDKNAANYSAIVAALKESGTTVGVLEKTAAKGELVDGMRKAVDEAQLAKVDVRDGIADALAVKEDEEVENIRRASAFTSNVLRFLVKKMEAVIDEEKVVKHSDLAKEVEDAIDDPKKHKLKTAVKLHDKMVELSPADIDCCFTPIIQSGGKYDLKASAESNSDALHAGTVICSTGARYKSYCSHIARTYLINATKEQQEVYGVVLAAQRQAIKELREGVELRTIMDKVIETVKNSRPELVANLATSFGVGIGLEFRETPTYMINAKSARTARAGMTFSVSVGVNGVPNPDAKDPKNKTFALLVTDTVLVRKDEDAELLTKVSSEFANVSYQIEEPVPEASKKKADTGKAPATAPASSAAAAADAASSSRARMESEAHAEQEQRKKHQLEIARKRNEEAAKKYAASTVDSQFNKASVSRGDLVAYKSPAEYPREAAKNQIFVDVKREAVLCPINGIFVPFHISTIRNVGKSDEGRFTYLRINFFTPGNQMPGQNQLVFKDGVPYIRELSYRSLDAKNINNTVRLIKELRKRVTSRDQENRDRASLVEQESLVTLPKGSKVLRLQDLQIRPNLSGRKTIGALELHTNGLRFQSTKGESVDITFKNIKHAFFQPAQNELIVLVHFHLHAAIMLGKKKTNDVQFFREVVEGSQALESNRRQYDPDELEEEDRERKRRTKMNQEFDGFVKKVEEAAETSGARLEWDIPYRDIGFFGTPNRSQVFLLPTVRCVVDLIEMPFFIVTMEEVEIAHFERVVHSLRNFDLVFVFKNYERQVVRINAIPMESLENVRKWLDSCEVQYYEGTANLNWNNIMKTIKADPQKFHTEDGGWKFLDMEGSSDEEGGKGEGGGEDSEDGEEYAPSDEESEEEEEESDDTSLDESDASEEEGSEEDGSEEEEEGKTWSDLEEEAREDDRRRGLDEEPEGKKGPAKKRKSREDDDVRPPRPPRSRGARDATQDFGRNKKKPAPAKPASRPAPPPPKAGPSKPGAGPSKPGAPKPAPPKPAASSSSGSKPSSSSSSSGPKKPGPPPPKPSGGAPKRP